MDLVGRYSDYESLKDYFNVPKGSDFGFGLIYNNGSVLETSFKDISKSIYVREVPIQYINLGGKI